MYLKVAGLAKTHGADEGYMQALRSVSTGVEEGKICVILGASGSGKATLLNIIGGLDETNMVAYR